MTWLAHFERAAHVTLFKRVAVAHCIVFIVAFVTVVSGCADSTTRLQGGSCDHLLGWFKLPGRNERKETISGQDALVPVFKQDGIYYSICRGFEVPLKECPEGLEWSVTPSSLSGTRIGWDAVSKTPYLAVRDQRASTNTDSRYGAGEREPMTRIPKPFGLLDVQARRPRTYDDFLGWYQPRWFPGMRVEVRKDGARYVSQEQHFHGPGSHSWKSLAEPRELTLLAERLGLTFEQDGGVQLVYHAPLKRFELVMAHKGPTPLVIRMPLARVPAPSTPESGATPTPTARLGIPAWH